MPDERAFESPKKECQRYLLPEEPIQVGAVTFSWVEVEIGDKTKGQLHIGEVEDVEQQTLDWARYVRLESSSSVELKGRRCLQIPTHQKFEDRWVFLEELHCSEIRSSTSIDSEGFQIVAVHVQEQCFLLDIVRHLRFSGD